MRGLTSTVCFPLGNLAPEGSVIKSTAIDPSLVDADEVYRHRGPARVFITEAAAIQAIKSGAIGHGDVIVLICGGPKGAGMQEIYQVTSALKALPHCKHVAVLTDARFSGVSTGACVGHISPEALAGGPIGKVLEGDQIEIVIDRAKLVGSVDAGRRRGKDIWRGRRRAACWHRVRCDRICGRIRLCPTTRGCGRRWCMPVAACGAGACMTRMQLWASLRRTRSG